MSTGAIVAQVIGCVVGALVLLGVVGSVVGTDSDSSSSSDATEIGGSDDDGSTDGADTTVSGADVPEGFELVDGDGVVMAAPAGWQVIDAADAAMGSEEFAELFPDAPPGMVEQGLNMFEQGAVLVAFDLGADEFASNVNVLKLDGEAPLGAIEGQAEQQLGTLGGEVLDTDVVEVALGEALRIVYTIAVAAPDGSSVNAAGVQYYLPHDGSTYIITVSTGDDAARVADVMIETFRVQ
jgi:hypothetical protein